MTDIYTSGFENEADTMLEFLLLVSPSGAIYALYLKFSTERNIVAEFHRENVIFTRRTAN